MSHHVVLVGTLAVGSRSALEQLVEVPVTFESVPDPSDTDRVLAALSEADVVVGDWPPQADASAAPNLNLMQRIGAGVDKLDRDRIPPDAYVCNVYQHGTAIAEHVFAMLLALRRKLLKFDADLRTGDWNRPRPPEGSVQDVRGSTLGVVGFGHIGRALVPRARGFGIDVLANRGSGPSDEPPEGVRFLGGPDDLDRILEDADAVVVTVPLTDGTRGLIGEHELDRMDEEAVLINVARGPVVEEGPLFEALEDGRIAGAGIDTWYRYPDRDERCSPSEYPFDELDNVVMTPHLAGWSDQTVTARYGFIAENIGRVARGETPKNVVWGPRTEE